MAESEPADSLITAMQVSSGVTVLMQKFYGSGVIYIVIAPRSVHQRQVNKKIIGTIYVNDPL